MKYSGGCHCGKVTIEVEGDIAGLVSCNCSICTKRGSLLWFAPRDHLKVTGESELATYTFNKHVIKHRFCKHCGVLPFGEGTDPKGVATAAINVRCLENFEFDQLPDCAIFGEDWCCASMLVCSLSSSICFCASRISCARRLASASA